MIEKSWLKIRSQQFDQAKNANAKSQVIKWRQFDSNGNLSSLDYVIMWHRRGYAQIRISFKNDQVF